MSTAASILEMLMLISFGISWPINIRKLWAGRTAKGSSVLFYFFILAGYLCGLVSKVLLIANAAPQAWYVTVKWYVIAIYLINTAMVTCGILIWFRNRGLDRRAAEDNK